MAMALYSTIILSLPGTFIKQIQIKTRQITYNNVKGTIRDEHI